MGEPITDEEAAAAITSMAAPGVCVCVCVCVYACVRACVCARAHMSKDPDRAISP